MPSQEVIDGMWQAGSVLGFFLSFGLIIAFLWFIVICLNALAKRWR